MKPPRHKWTSSALIACNCERCGIQVKRFLGTPGLFWMRYGRWNKIKDGKLPPCKETP